MCPQRYLNNLKFVAIPDKIGINMLILHRIGLLVDKPMVVMMFVHGIELFVDICEMACCKIKKG